MRLTLSLCFLPTHRLDDISPEDEAEMERVAVARGLARAAETGPSTPTPASPMAAASSSTTSASPLDPERAPPTSPDLPVSNAIPPPANSSPLLRSPPRSAAPSAPSTRPALPRSNSSYQGGSSSNLNPADLSTAELMTICQGFIDQLRSGSAPWLLQRLNNTYGPMPSDPSVCGYWMASVSAVLHLILTQRSLTLFHLYAGNPD